MRDSSSYLVNMLRKWPEGQERRKETPVLLQASKFSHHPRQSAEPSEYGTLVREGW